MGAAGGWFPPCCAGGGVGVEACDASSIVELITMAAVISNDDRIIAVHLLLKFLQLRAARNIPSTG